MKLKINILYRKYLGAAIGVSLLLLTFLAPGCSSLTKTQKGAAIGAGAGATVGAVIGKAAGNAGLGAIIGGAVGGTAGAYIGAKMDKVSPNKQAVAGAAINVKFDSPLLFEAGMAEVSPAAKTSLSNLAVSMQNNPGITATITGYADSTETNGMDISRQRAEAVKSVLVADSVSAARLTTTTKGAASPVAGNNTPEGRAKNRRVEITLAANDQPKTQAAQTNP